MSFLIGYLIFGLGLYIGMVLKSPEGFVEAGAASLARGFILGIPLWPIGLIIAIVIAMDNLTKEKP